MPIYICIYMFNNQVTCLTPYYNKKIYIKMRVPKDACFRIHIYQQSYIATHGSIYQITQRRILSFLLVETREPWQ